MLKRNQLIYNLEVAKNCLVSEKMEIGTEMEKQTCLREQSCHPWRLWRRQRMWVHMLFSLLIVSIFSWSWKKHCEVWKCMLIYVKNCSGHYNFLTGNCLIILFNFFFFFFFTLPYIIFLMGSFKNLSLSSLVRSTNS